MRPQLVTVGPLAASSANNIAQSQKAASALQLVLNGTTGTSVATSVCASQSAAGAQALLINGTTVNSNSGAAVAYLQTPSRIFINDGAGNNSGITYTITGTGIVGAGTGVGFMNGANFFAPQPIGVMGGAFFGVTEVITGSNASIVSSKNIYWTITSITTSGATAAAITVGSYGAATLDNPRQIGIASAGNDTGITFTLAGTDWGGLPITEVVTGASGATANSVLSYKTISSVLTSGAVATTVTVGTTSVAYSQWATFDPYGGMAQTSIAISGTGTVNWTLQQTLDDPNSVFNPVSPQNMVWINSQDPACVSSAVTAGVNSNFTFLPIWSRILLNSGSGSVRAQFVQTFLGG